MTTFLNFFVISVFEFTALNEQLNFFCYVAAEPRVRWLAVEKYVNRSARLLSLPLETVSKKLISKKACYFSLC